MTDTIFRYLIPLACGYLTFLMISRKWLPWRRPVAILDRPRWLLGCCLGAIIAICLTLFMQFSFGKPVSEAAAVALPLGFISLTLLTGTLLAWLGYRKRCQQDHQSFVETDLLADINTEEVHNDSDIDQVSLDAPPAELAEDAPLGKTETEFLSQARKIAHQEHQLRCEAEKNLRITRKALLKLESEQYREDDGKSEKELLLETQLRDLVSSNARVENKLLREADKSGLLESRLADAKVRVVEANQEVRNNIDARARAILTARKSVNFAKRTIEARDRAERQLESTRIQLKIQSETTSKVLKALEREREKSRELRSKIDSLMGTQEAKGLRKVQPTRVSRPAKQDTDKASRSAGRSKSRLIRRIAEPGKAIRSNRANKVQGKGETA